MGEQERVKVEGVGVGVARYAQLLGYCSPPYGQ